MSEDQQYDTVNVAGIGLGGLGMTTLEETDKHAYATVVAGYDPFEGARDRFSDTFDAARTYDDFNDMISSEDLDAVYIISTHTAHYEQAKQCLENGMDVFVEKPMVTDTDEARDLVETAEREGRILHVGFQRHLHPGYQKMRGLINDGVIGDIEHVEAELHQPGWADHFWDAWRSDADYAGGGELYDSGQHVLDAVIWATSSRPIAAEAKEFTYIDEVIDLPEDDDLNRDRVDVMAEFKLEMERYADGHRFDADIGVYGAPVDGGEAPDTLNVSEWITVHGTDGVLTFTNDGDETLEVYNSDREPLTVEAYGTMYTYQELIRMKVDAFVNAVREGERNGAATGKDGMIVTAATEGAYEADENGGYTSFDSLRGDA